MNLGQMTYYIRIGDYRLKVIDSVTIKKSVENLADTATIILPGTHINKSLEIEDKIKEGDAVEISLGYNSENVPEFKGYLNSVATVGANITIECEDGLYVFRKQLKNVELKNTTVLDLLNHVVVEVNILNKAAGDANETFRVECDYVFKYDKFVISDATGYDILKKVQEESKANIYFKDQVLHVHPQYKEIFNDQAVIYDFAVNIEKSDLKYKTADKRKYQIEVEGVAADGKRIKTTIGKMGGDKRSIKVFGVTDLETLKKRGEQELQTVVYTGYEGHFTGWLIPFVEPAYKIRLQDSDYVAKQGNYYVVAVETKFSRSGGERVVTIGKKIE